jgi:tetratricopeptide (TPR) repeat protein
LRKKPVVVAAQHAALVVVGLVLFELVLQIAAFATWRLYGRSRAQASTDPTVLCVGDSYTYGFGATSTRTSYPAQLEELLQKHGLPWRVVNGGLPGRNSHDLVVQLRGQLRESRPAIVYVMVGVNDMWSHPGRAAEAGAPQGPPSFPKRVRTLRLLALARQAIRGPRIQLPRAPATPSLDPASSAEPPQATGPTAVPATPVPLPVPSGRILAELVGSWNHDGRTARFGADGHLNYCGTDGRWAVDGEEIVVHTREPEPLRLRWALRGGVLHLSGGPLGQGAVLERGAASRELPCRTSPTVPPSATPPPSAPPPPTAEEQAGMVALQARQYSAAEKAFDRSVAEAAAKGAEASAPVHAGLARIYAQTGRTEKALAELAWLERDYERTDRPEGTAQLVVSVAEELNETRTVVRVARDALKKYPRNPWLWKAVAWQTFQEGDLAGAEAAIDKAIAYIPTGPQGDLARPFFQEIRAVIVTKRDPKSALRHAVSAFLRDGNEVVVTDQLTQIGPATGEAALDSLLEELAVKGEDRVRLKRIMANAFDPDTKDALAILEWNVRQAVLHIRNANAEPVLIGYPFRSPVGAVLEKVAAETRTGWIDLSEQIEQRLATGVRREELFVPDGHLSDVGYAVLAETVSKDVLLRAGSP